MVSIFNRIKKYNNCDNRHHYLLTRGNKKNRTIWGRSCRG